jgi:hypothetical protein
MSWFDTRVLVVSIVAVIVLPESFVQSVARLPDVRMRSTDVDLLTNVPRMVSHTPAAGVRDKPRGRLLALSFSQWSSLPYMTKGVAL